MIPLFNRPRFRNRSCAPIGACRRSLINFFGPALFSLLFTCIAQAQTVRVTSWSLGTNTGSDNPNSLAEAASSLQKLNPDVILLEDVADWQMCNRLAESLRPATYNVVVCSAFRAVDGQIRPQVAILSRHKAYISWAQNWRSENGEISPSGFVFAAIQIGQRRLAFFSLQSGANGKPTQWLRAIGGVKSWVNNRVEGLIAAGPLNAETLDRASLQLLEEAGFSNPFLSQFSDTRNTGPVAASIIANVTALQGVLLDHWPATCDIGIEIPPAGTVITAVRGRLLPPEPPPIATIPAKAEPAGASSAIPATSTPNGWQTHVWWILPAFGLIAIASVLRGLSASRKRIRSHREPALLPLNAGGSLALSRTQIALIAPVSSTGSTTAIDSSAIGQSLVKMTAPHEVHSDEDWKRRALIAERQAREATELVHRGLLPQVNQWLKGKFVKKLLDDRAQTGETQEQATIKTLHVGERLARLEQQLQLQNRAYQERIDTLTRELRAARSENCDLIRAQINQVKAEMEASRAKLLAEAVAEFPK